jgi:hypothetical protein
MNRSGKYFLILFGCGVLGFIAMRSAEERAPTGATDQAVESAPPPEVADGVSEFSSAAAEARSAKGTASGGSAASPKANVYVTDERERSIATELSRLKSCWKLGSCGFAETDSRSADFEAAERIEASLLDLLDVKRENPGADLSEYAREWLHFPDDTVREAALTLLAMHSVTEENLRALLDGLERSHSAPLYGRALPVLRRYQSEGYQTEVNAFLVGVLREGGLFASETVARGILPFLDHSNIATFEGAARKMVAGGRGRRYLEAAISEYHLLQAGG